VNELRSRSKEEKKGSRSKEAKKGLALAKIKILEEVKGETYNRSPLPPTQA
jgi:hypothetical protein